MAKDRKNSYQGRQSQPQKSKYPLFFILGGAAILIITAIFAFQKPPAPYTPEVTGGPSLRADKEALDFGDVKLGKTVTASFELKNIGDQPLSFSNAPYVELIEGC